MQRERLLKIIDSLIEDCVEEEDYESAARLNKIKNFTDEEFDDFVNELAENLKRDFGF